MSGTVYTVASGKGGVGKTTTSVNLAVALWQEGHAVGLVDADIGMANLAAVLNLEPEATLHDVLSGQATVEEALVEAQGGNLLVLPGDRSLESFANADPRELRAAVDELAERCDYVIVDTGAGLSYEDVLPLGMAHGVLLVTTPDPAAFGDTHKTMEVADLLGAPIRGLVVTRAVADTDAAAIAGEIGAELLGTIPEDPAVMASTVAGNPLESHAPDSAAAGAYRDLAATLLAGDEEWLEAHPREPAATVDEVASAVAVESGENTGEAGAAATEDAADAEEATDIGDLLAEPGEDDESGEERGRASPGEAPAGEAAETEGALEDQETESAVEPDEHGADEAEPMAASAGVDEPTGEEDDRADEEADASSDGGPPDADEAGEFEPTDDLDETDEPPEPGESEETEEDEEGGDEEGEESEDEVAEVEAEVAEEEAEEGEEEAEVAEDEEEGGEAADVDESADAEDEEDGEEGEAEPESAEPGDEDQADESEDEIGSEDAEEPEEAEPAEPEKRGGVLGWLGRLF